MEQGFTPKHDDAGWKVLQPDHHTGKPELVDVSIFAITQAKRFDCIEVVKSEEGYIAILKGDAPPADSGHPALSSDMTPLGLAARVRAMARTGLWDSPPEEVFDRLTELASAVLKCPICLITLVTADRQFFKSQHGITGEYAASRGSLLPDSVCALIAANGKELVIGDACRHPLVKDLPMVTKLHIQAYAGYPIWSSDKFSLGSFCVMDHKPRHWTKDETLILSEFAGMASLCAEAAEMRIKLSRMHA
jgi:hypothetical protein